MGKTKQAKAKFDRNVEISAPILDAETIRAIHSPPKDKKLDMSHGGFKALLSDLTTQDSTDEVAPITENHLPSYIGISCAVSGYSNYSSYVNRRPLSEITTTTSNNSNHNNNIINSQQQSHETRDASRLAANNSRLSSSSAANRSRTSSPLAKRNDQPPIHHVTIDRSTMSSADQERKELTEKLTSSATERTRAPPSPLPPLEDGRHHGAYVGARYFPMPEPSKVVHKHIPLLGIDDDQNPDELVVEDINKVEKQIANLYGDEFVEDWKESMSHKARKEHEEMGLQAGNDGGGGASSKNLKDLVTLRPAPVKAPEPVVAPADVPTPDVKVLAGVEKQFLNRLLTDENPPMPKSPSPQPTSPVSPRYSRPIVSPGANIQTSTMDTNIRESVGGQSPVAPTPSPPPAKQQKAPTPTPEPTPEPQSPEPLPEAAASPVASPSPVASSSPIQEASPNIIELDQESPAVSPAPLSESPVNEQRQQQQQLISTSDSLSKLSEGAPEQAARDEIITLDEQLNATLGGGNDHHVATPPTMSQQPDLPIAPSSPDSVQSHSTVEEARGNGNRSSASSPNDEIHREAHIEYEIRAQSPLDNQSSPVKVLDSSLESFGPESSIIQTTMVEQQQQQNSVNLVSFSPEPTEVVAASEFNNNEDGATKAAAAAAMGRTDLSEMLSADRVLVETNPEGDDPLEPEMVGCEPVVAVAASPAAEQVRAQEVEAAAATAASGGDTVVRDGRYFLATLKAEESFILEQVKLAEARLAEHEAEWAEETIGKVRSAIGKANLLINKKCNQFRELCEKSLVNDASDQYAVLNDDLAGFWDMISIQIVDVKKSFESL